ncbi:insulin-like growth factor-binding protein 3 [Pundamilia nyererei]|uniref:Insulin-like growth factor-binding protein 3 n=2 Tax=Haplochromini TaxID=319058 RepID=A0A3B4H8G2_9CICH|nr:PREDICTED: insulin-like growth factor-binding protein 3 [Pundamilia nyererei]XP_005937285.1 insulin-like growth factor-binding protein 3 isoform X2 [Haplochromis burtoni]
MPDVCVLCLVAALAAFARLAGTVGPVVRCEPCDAGALLQCKPLPKDCVERVKEPGCGCCMTCALGEGQPCGVYTGRCGSGLTCRHQPGESRPLQALLEGRGVCSSPKKLNSVLMPPQKEENAGNQVEDSVNVTQTITVLPGVGTVKDGHSRGSMDTRPPLHNILIQRGENRKTQSYKVESLSGGANTDVHNFSVESKRENEYGPCRREMESILNSLKISNVLNPRGFRIPNCDRKGFYKKKQCRPSKGRRRGYCWCVDKYGQPLPGYDGRQWGEKQCYNLESK